MLLENTHNLRFTAHQLRSSTIQIIVQLTDDPTPLPLAPAPTAWQLIREKENKKWRRRQYRNIPYSTAQTGTIWAGNVTNKCKTKCSCLIDKETQPTRHSGKVPPTKTVVHLFATIRTRPSIYPSTPWLVHISNFPHTRRFTQVVLNNYCHHTASVCI